MLVACDPGNGAVKALAPGRPPVTFPSLVAATDRQWLAGYGDPPLEVDGACWRVGADARFEPNPIWPGPADRLRNPEVVPLMAEALWRLGATGPITLATGGPLRVYNAEAPSGAAAWQGRTLHLRRGDQARTVTVSACRVFPQGLAALLACYPLARSVGRWPADGLVGLLDIGRGTTELVAVDAATRQPRLALCTSLDLGAGTAVSALQRWLQDRVQAPVTTDQAETAWRTGRLAWRHATIDAAPGQALAAEAVAGRLAADVQHWWRDVWAHLQLIILVGASAPAWAPRLATLHDHCWVPPDPAFANAHGFLRLAEGAGAAAAL
jgi:hypothetical protein